MVQIRVGLIVILSFFDDQEYLVSNVVNDC